VAVRLRRRGNVVAKARQGELRGRRVLAAGEYPHVASLNEFRAKHRQALANLCHQILRECMSAGLVKLGHVVIDGTKMKRERKQAQAMSYERMEKEDARLTAEIETFLDQADATDAEEDKRYGVSESATARPPGRASAAR
jgi:hypothetical protein